MTALAARLGGSRFRRISSASQTTVPTSVSYDVTPRPGMPSAMPAATGISSALCWSPRHKLYLCISATVGTATYLSRDGVRWFSGGALPASVSWNHAIWCDEFRRFVVTAYGGTSAYSTDGGRTWTAGPGVSANSRKPAYSARHRTIISSVNGATTANISTNGGTTYSVSAVLSAADNQTMLWIDELNLWVNVSINGVVRYAHPNKVFTAWSAGTGLTGFTTAYSAAWSPQLGIAVTIGNGQVGYSRDGINWKTISGPTGNYWHIVWNPVRKLFAACSLDSTKFIWSFDGLTWLSRTIPASSTGSYNLVACAERGGEMLTTTNTESTAIIL